jgi:hypothetical protein
MTVLYGLGYLNIESNNPLSTTNTINAKASAIVVNSIKFRFMFSPRRRLILYFSGAVVA